MRKSPAILVILATLWLALPAAAAAPTVVLGSSVLEVAAGQTESLPVTVTDVQDLYGLEIHLRFDPGVVQVADADPNTDGIQVAAGDFLSADFVAQNRADNQAGTVDYAVTQVNPNEPRTGSGTLLVIRFQGGAASQATQVEVTNGLLTTRDGDLIPVTFTRGEVRVKGASAVADTATSTPTAAPGGGGGAKAGDAPTATRAFTNTPMAADATPTAQPPATLVQPPAPSTAAAVAPAPTQRDAPTIAVSTQTPQAAAAAAAAATSVPPAAVAQARSTAPRSSAPTSALVAKTSAGSPRKAILEPGASAKAGASEPAPAVEHQASPWLLIGAAALIGLAGVVAAATFWLPSRRRRA